LGDCGGSGENEASKQLQLHREIHLQRPPILHGCTIAHMPYRINGIGTGYYGRKNASARNGRCEFCKRETTLTSYDTREWFSVVFIPLIPLTPYRILESCGSCRRHRRLPLAEFQKQLDE